MPFGPCGRWQLRQPCAKRPWGVLAWLVWQLAQLLTLWLPPCGSWQLVQTWCPAGAVACSDL